MSDESVAVEDDAVVESKATPKSKAEMGIPEDQIVTWVPFAQTAERNKLVARVVRSRNAVLNNGESKANVASIYVDLLTKAITPELLESWEAEAAKIPEPKAKSATSSKVPTDPEEQAAYYAEKQSKLEVRANKITEAINRAKNAIAAAKAKNAERNAGVVATSADDEADGSTS